MCALITFRTQTSKFIINKQPQSLHHMESLDPSAERRGCCVSLGEAKGGKRTGSYGQGIPIRVVVLAVSYLLNFLLLFGVIFL